MKYLLFIKRTQFSYISKGQNVIILTSTNDINQQVISKGLENIPAAKEIDEIALNRLNLAHVFDPWAVLTFLDSLVVQSTSTSGQTDLLLIVGLDQLLGPLQDKRERGGSSSGNVSTAVSCEPVLASLLLRLRRVAGFGTSVIVCSGLTQQQVNAPATASTFYESFDIALSIKPGLQPGFASAGE